MPARPLQAASPVGAAALVVAALLALTGTASAQARLQLRFEAGTEYDSNVHRDERLSGDPPSVADGLFRTIGRGDLVVRTSDRTQLRLSYAAGGKVFFGLSPANPVTHTASSREEDVFVQQGAAAFQIRLQSPLVLGFTADYYDAFQRVSRRDFRTVSGAGLLTASRGETSVSISAGYRDFVWKPDHNFDFRGDQYGALFFTRFLTGQASETDDETEWELQGSYFVSRRHYAGPVIANGCAPDDPILPTCLQLRTGQREDLFHEATVGATYVKALLLGLSYGLQVNQSTSFGQSLVRHVVTARLAARPFKVLSTATRFRRLLRELYLTLQVTIQFNQFGDPVLLGSDVQAQTFRSIEDENRNSVLVGLTRDLPVKGLAIEARYALFTNEFATSAVQFLRQLVYLGLRFDTRFEWRGKKKDQD